LLGQRNFFTWQNRLIKVTRYRETFAFHQINIVETPRSLLSSIRDDSFDCFICYTQGCFAQNLWQEMITSPTEGDPWFSSLCQLSKNFKSRER